MNIIMSNAQLNRWKNIDLIKRAEFGKKISIGKKGKKQKPKNERIIDRYYEIVNKEQSKFGGLQNYRPYFCDCGCMEICSYGRRYVVGHNGRGHDSVFAKMNMIKNGSKERRELRKIYNPGAAKVKELWKDPEWRANTVAHIMKASHVRPNFKEKGILMLLKNETDKAKYTGDGSKIIGGKNPDFVIEGTNKIIEFAGRRWHKPEYEAIRIKHFENYSYQCLIIWGEEFKKLEQLKLKIRNFLEG